MKNIERQEVILSMLKFLTDKSYGTSMLLYDLYKFGMPEDMYKRRAWLYSEYVEPHKWTKNELENMMHIDKMISKIHKYVNGYDFQSNDSRMCVVNLIDLFPSMKVGEEINIDEELERNGMNR